MIPGSAGVSTHAERLSAPLFLLYLMWVLLLFEPDWFLSSLVGGGSVLKRMSTLLAPVLLLLAFQQLRREAFLWTYILFVAMHAAHIPSAENRGLLIHNFQGLYHFFFVFLGTVCLVRSPDRIVPLLKIYLLHFVWFGVQGARTGFVGWHSTLSNTDSFGPLMSIGIGFAYYYAMGSRSRLWRWIGIAGAALCVVGVIASIARGAVLSALAVLAVVWLRSPRKVRTLAAGIAAAIVALGAIRILFPSDEFWTEMATITDEGMEEGTGLQRKVLWDLGMDVFRKHPVFGVGPNNFGPVASRTIPFDPKRPQYRYPQQLYNVQLHNIYVQLLCETGIVGSAIWLALLLDFFRRLRWLRSPAARDYWDRRGGGAVDVRCVSLGLECAMVGYLANGIFYNQIYETWFWVLITVAYILSVVAVTPRGWVVASGQGSEDRAVGSSRPPTSQGKRTGAAGTVAAEPGLRLLVEIATSSQKILAVLGALGPFPLSVSRSMFQV